MSDQPNVADYIIQRLAREGISDCFGVAGDFAFKLNDAVARSKSVRWIGCSNELDAAYAADGYARVRGCSMLMTTYAVGELSALNGVEPSRMLVCLPCCRHAIDANSEQARSPITRWDGEFQNFEYFGAGSRFRRITPETV